MMILKTSRSNLSSNDQLSLDLPFAETKSLIARVGPTPVFTRASGATYIGSDGLIHGVDTSTTSNTIGTGSRTFTLAATAGQDQLWRAGDAVEAANGANLMVGTVTSYTAATQVLVCNMTTTSGSGTFTSWRIGYRGPRFDHTSAGVCRGLLIEESRTNLSILSDQLSNAVQYGRQGLLPVSADISTAPDGNTSADKIIENTSNSIHRLFTPSFNATSGITYTASVFAKSDGRRYLYLNAGSPFNAQSTFDLQNGVISGTGIGSSSITNFGNGWYRCTVTGTATATGSGVVSLHINNTVSTAFDDTYTGNGTSGLLLWGVQVEAGAFATSYIPTTTAPLARSADVCNITGGDFTNFYNQSEGTFLSNWSDFSPVNINNWPIPITTNSNFIARSNGYSDYNPSSPGAVVMGNGSVTLESHYSRIRNILIKQASAYSGSGMAISSNGLAVRTNPALFATNQTFLKLHGYDTGSQFNGHFAAIRYYKKRLSNAKLQALTV